MSVIGKMSANAELFENRWSKGQKLNLNCLCENELMAHYTPQNEDVVFSQYSPFGQGSFHLDKPIDVDTGEQFYLVYSRGPERPNVDGAAFWAAARCNSVTDFGGTSRQVEVCSRYGTPEHEDNESRTFNLKLGIDNPHAFNQFEPQQDDWWVRAYRAKDMSMAEALALARA